MEYLIKSVTSAKATREQGLWNSFKASHLQKGTALKSSELDLSTEKGHMAQDSNQQLSRLPPLGAGTSLTYSSLPRQLASGLLSIA